MNRVAHLLRRVAWNRNGVEREQPRKFVAGKRAETFSFGGNLLVAHQAAIEPRHAPVRHDVADGVVHRIVGIAIVGPVIALDVKGLCLLDDGDRLLRKLLRLHGGHVFRFGAGSHFAEILLQHRHHGGSLYVAHHGNHKVRPHVILFMEVHGLGGRNLAHFAGPANGTAAVRVGYIGSGQELLHKPANRVGVGAHAALFDHHRTLRVEFARNRVDEAAAFQIRPQFQPVLRHRPVVHGLVETC